MGDAASISDYAWEEGEQFHRMMANEWAKAPAHIRDARFAPWRRGALVFPSHYGRPTTRDGRIHRSGFIAGWNSGRDAWVAEHYPDGDPPAD